MCNACGINHHDEDDIDYDELENDEVVNQTVE